MQQAAGTAEQNSMINSLSLENFRNFEALQLSFDAPSVIISGANGQGKTSVLEAVFYLANLRSFRTAKLREMRKLGTEYFRLKCSLSTTKWHTKLEVENTIARKLKIDDVPVSKASDFTGKIQTVAFLPDDPEIIGGTSLLRRRFFDMFISMMDQNYFTALQLYSGALKERNFLLRSERQFDPQIIRSYHPILAENGALIVQKRYDYAHILMDSMRSIFEVIRPEFSHFSVKMRAQKETFSAEEFQKKLDERIEQDKERGFTALGPHLDDFDFIANGKNLRIYGSNGQKRIISFALKMAEFDIVSAKEEARKNTIVIVDDATGDLDYKTKTAFFDKIRNAGQLFFAFTDIDNDPLFNRSQIITLANGAAQI